MKKSPMKVGVKVMRSYDYCHFEIALECEEEEASTKFVDSMRKSAMRLVDKAVEQYKIARKLENAKTNIENSIDNLRREVTAIKENFPKKELTPEHKAKIKKLRDWEYLLNHKYDYEDDFDYDIPF